MKNKTLIITVLLYITPVKTECQYIDGTIDTTFNSGTGANYPISSFGMQTDNKIIVGGAFTSINGTERNLIARIFPEGKIDSTFISPFYVCSQIGGCNPLIGDILTLNDGTIIVRGNDLQISAIDNKNQLRKLLSNGFIDNSFQGFPNRVSCIALQSDNKIIIGGCTNYNGTTPVQGLLRIFSNGSIDSTFDCFSSGVQINKQVYSCAVQPDGKILISGNFLTFKGETVNYLTRLNADASIDHSFNCGQGPSHPCNILVQEDGKILLYGSLNTYNGVNVGKIVRLNQDGTIDDSFNVGYGANNVISSIILTENNKIVVTGLFTTFNNISVNKVIRLLPNGTLDPEFTPYSGPNPGGVNTMILSEVGKILLGGSFLTYDNIPTHFICRIHAGGSTGVEDALQDKGFAIYPNPANDYITIANYQFTILDYQFSIHNYTGQTVHTQKLNPNQTTVDVNCLAPGLYFVKVGEQVSKFMRE